MKKIFVFVVAVLGVFASASNVDTSGNVYVNDKKIDKNSVIKLGDFIKTGNNSKIKFNIGKDAFMAKENTKFSILNNNGIKSLNVVAGGVLAVFEKGGGNHEVKTENMTAGIRGTGVYLEQIDGKSYFCTCYGETELKSDKEHKNYHATHHNMLWIKTDGSVKAAQKMRGHSDEELRELEAMVGRVPEFDKK